MTKRTAHLLAIIFLVAITLSCTQKLYTSQDLLGTWVTKADEPIDGKCTIEFTPQKDGTTVYTFFYEDGRKFSASGKDWKYINGVYEETYTDGTKGKGKIEWVNKNKFNLIILENQATDLYKGRVRVYERKK